MPITTKKSIKDDLTEHVVSGEVFDKEMFECEKQFYDNGPTNLQLWDMSEAKLTNITTEGMRQFMIRTAQLGKSRPYGRTAVVVKSQLQYGLGRVAETFGEFESIPFSFRLFKDRKEAIEWLKSKISDD